MDFVARLDAKQLTGPAIEGAAAMRGLRAATVEADAALRQFDEVAKAGGAAAASADAGKAAGSAAQAAQKVDAAGAAWARLKANLASTGAARAGARAIDAVKSGAEALGGRASKAWGLVAAPAGKAFDAVGERWKRVTEGVRGNKAFQVVADSATLAGGAVGRAFGAAGRLTGGALTGIAGGARFAGGKVVEAFSGAGKSLGSFLGPLKGMAPMLLAGLGAAGLAGLGKLALGYQGVARMQGITARLQLDFRRLFSGVDPSPAIRAYDRFAKNFSKGSVMGAALGDIFTRSFNGIFRLLEKAEPYVTAFGQGMVLAFLYAELAVLKARVAFFPYEDTLGSVISKSGLLKAAAVGGGLALLVAAGFAVAAAAPFLVLGAAILAVVAAFEQASKLSEEWDSSVMGRQIRSHLGLLSDAEREKEQGIVTGDDYDKQSAARAAAKGADPAAAKAGGVAAGKELGAGLVAGMKSKEAEVVAAGSGLAKAADAGVRAGAEIKSPSRMMRRTAGELGEGAVLGIRDKAGAVQRAADESLVPSMSSRGGLAGGVMVQVTIAQILIQGVVGTPEDQEAMIRRGLALELKAALAEIGA